MYLDVPKLALYHWFHDSFIDLMFITHSTLRGVTLMSLMSQWFHWEMMFINQLTLREVSNLKVTGESCNGIGSKILTESTRWIRTVYSLIQSKCAMSQCPRHKNWSFPSWISLVDVNREPRSCSHLLKQSLMENSTFFVEWPLFIYLQNWLL